MKQVRKELGIVLWCCLAAFVFFVQIGPAVAAQSYILVIPVHYPGGHGPSDQEPVLHFEFTGTGPLASFTPIPADQAVHDPHSLAFSRQGELFISNSYEFNGAGSVSRFILDSNGNFIPNGTIEGNSLSAVGPLAFSAGGELFVANQINTIFRFLFDSTGVATPNGTFVTGYDNQGLAFSSSGELFTAHATDFITRFLFDPSTGHAIPNGSFTVPGAVALHGLAFSSQGELFAAEPYTSKVFRIRFDASGPVMNGAISVPGAPVGVTFSGEGELFVTTHFVGGISRFLFDASGNAVANGVTPTDHLGGVAIFAIPAPVALCQDVTVYAGPTCTAPASIDNGSYEPNNNSVTLTQAPAGPYSLGNTSVTLTVSDNKGASSKCTGTVTVLDKTSPAITMASVNPSVLWPPNHKMVDVTVDYKSTDNCIEPLCKISGVTSNEPISSSDYSIMNAHHVKLSAERLGGGNGRIYTIAIVCTDAANNPPTTQTITVTVPHDQGKN